MTAVTFDIMFILFPGGKALDKKQRKAWQAQVLERLGARPDKLPRCSAKIGQGMAKKKAERESRALQEAIAAGTVRVKGQGRKRQAEKGKFKKRLGFTTFLY